MKVSDLPQFNELIEGDRVVIVRSDGTVGTADKSLLGSGSSGGGGSSPPPALSMASGTRFLIMGTFDDVSGNNNHLTPVVNGQSPVSVTGLDGKPALRWDGSGSGELQAPYFMDGATAATLYAVFTVDPTSSHYNLARTRNNDDYWRFAANGAGYFGTFRVSRLEGHPAAMPGSGSHLLVVRSWVDGYEILIDNVSQGILSGNFNPGDRFRVGVNGLYSKLDLLLEAVYPRLTTAEEFTQNLEFIKDRFPSLPFTL